MKILLIALFSLTSILLNAQTSFETTEAKFTTEITLPFSTPEVLPIVGEYANEILQFSESAEEKNELNAWAAIYPEITDELFVLVGESSNSLNGSAQYYPYGKFKVGETTFLMVLETGREARSRRPFQNLVLLAFDKDLIYKDIRYIMHEEFGYEYDEEEYEDAIDVSYHTFYSSQLDETNDILAVKTIELLETEIVKANETIVEKSSYTTDFKYLPTLGQFEVQFD